MSVPAASTPARAVLLASILTFGVPAAMAQPHLVSDTAEAPLRGAYEVTLTAAPGFTNAFLENDVRVTFTKLGGERVTVNGFYDGGNTFKARAYLDDPGAWSWFSTSGNAGLNANTGAFTVVPAADLPGKLRKSAGDPRQFATDRGDWFLHLGDTGYRYINGNESRWQAYIDQAADVGFTKVRTWFGTPGNSGAGNSNGNIAYMFQNGGLNLAELQTADQRLIYALNEHPEVQMQLIPFGEDHQKLKEYADPNDPDHAIVRAYAREVQARYGALPNVQWTLSNDRNIAGDVTLRTAVDTLGADWKAAEAWGTLLTNHQARTQTYSYTNAPWSDIVTFEHQDQVDGERILYYRDQGVDDPIVNDEDRYETWIAPAHDRYFFRRMMWASLLSGGHATYGGGATWLPYSPNTAQGIQGYHDLNAAGLLQGGADDFNHIHRFFDETGLDLVGLTPADGLVGNNRRRAKAIYGDDVLIAYLANPTGETPQFDNVATTTLAVTIAASVDYAGWYGAWFNPTTGEWTLVGQLTNGDRTFTAPAGGDWVLLLRATPIPEPAASLAACAAAAFLPRPRRRV